MKSNVDIHVVLSTPEDLEDFHEDADEASDKLNLVLHVMYDKAEEDIDTQRLEKLLQYAWEFWHREQNLNDLDEDDLLDWVDHTLATWDDAENEDLY